MWNYSLFASSLQSTISCISIQFASWQHDCGRSLLSTIALLLSCVVYVEQIVAGGGGTQLPLHAGGVPPYFQYPALAGCVQAGTQPHVIQHGGGTVPQLCNGGVKFVLQPTATIPVAPAAPLCITSLVLTPVSRFQGE